MDNPIEVAFNAVGDRFFTTTFVLHPGGGKRDGIVHAIYGAVYGKDHDVVNDHVRTGPLFGPMTHLGPAAPSGLATLQSDLLIPDGRGLLACTQFNLQKVSLHELQPMGATYRTIDRDLLISDAIDFHPTDVLEDVDGSLLVIDTGGWYDLCCPTSGLDQAKAYGGIYRIRRAGDAVADPRGKELAWDRLSLEQQVGLLSDPRPFVRRQAAEALQSHGPAVVPLLEALAQNPGALSDRCDAVWLLDRSGSTEARQSLSRLAQHADDPVAQAALRALSLRPTDADALVAEAALADCEAPHRQRAGAELLSRLPGQRSAPAILAALGDLPLSAADGLPDRTTFHALTYALIRQGSAVEDDPLLRQALEDGPPAARAAVLLCIDQHDARGQLMPPSATQPIVDAWLAGSPIERGTAHWILGHRPEAAAAIADRWEDVLQRVADEIETPPADGLRSLEVLADQLAEPALVERTAAWLRDVDADHPAALAILEQGLARNHSERLPRGWVMAIVERLPQAESPLRDGLFNVLRGQKVDDDLRAVVCERLDDVAARADLPLETRLAALAARPAAGPALPPAALAAMQDGLSAESGSSLRRMALEGLQRVPVSTELHGLLVELAQSANPVELPPLLATIQRDGSADLARQIIAAMIDNPAAWRLPPQSLDGFSSVSDPAVQAALQTLQQRTAHAMAEQRDQLARLLGELDEGDAVAGYQVFRSSKAACSACHEIGYVGGQVGPDLSKIGSIRRRAELLEAIVMPSNSIVQSYDPVSIVTLDGRVFNGLVKETRPDGLLLVTGVDQQVRLQHDEIDTMQSSDVSIMPAGLEQVLTRRELADLLAFLESAR
jgi:putative heme-binding domain-containing protein